MHAFSVDCPPCLDIAIAVDSSGSIGQFRWNRRVIPFLRQFAKSDQWNISFADNYGYQVNKSISPTKMGTSAYAHFTHQDGPSAYAHDTDNRIP